MHFIFLEVINIAKHNNSINLLNKIYKLKSPLKSCDHLVDYQSNEWPNVKSLDSFSFGDGN